LPNLHKLVLPPVEVFVNTKELPVNTWVALFTVKLTVGLGLTVIVATPEVSVNPSRLAITLK
jgi:hypothetical protein